MSFPRADPAPLQSLLPPPGSTKSCGNIWAYYARIGNTSERRSAGIRFSYSSDVHVSSFSLSRWPFFRFFPFTYDLA